MAQPMSLAGALGAAIDAKPMSAPVQEVQEMPAQTSPSIGEQVKSGVQKGLALAGVFVLAASLVHIKITDPKAGMGKGQAPGEGIQQAWVPQR